MRRFVQLAASELGSDGIKGQGEGLQETGLRADTGATVVRLAPRYYRLDEVETLMGDPTKAR